MYLIKSRNCFSRCNSKRRCVHLLRCAAKVYNGLKEIQVMRRERRWYSVETTKSDADHVKQRLCEKYNAMIMETPIKSKSDKKEYLAMKLHNGLRALLISDVVNMLDESSFKSDVKTQKEILEYRGIYKGTNQKERLAACSLTVSAGSFDDPEETPGLAHMLEHMLFLGSAKYPAESDFDSFLSARGGSSNAMTNSQSTSYFFDCPEPYMEEALDRFVQFFISPSLSQDMISREIKAIESEFQLSSKNDRLRVRQVIMTTAAAGNPASKFQWGNLKALMKGIPDNSLRRALQTFRETHYTPNKMTVAIRARLPLSTLSRWVTDGFGKIPVGTKPVTSLPRIKQAFEPEPFRKMYTVMPVSDRNLLQLAWELPALRQRYKTKPTLYASFMVNNESKGSLFSYLKKNLWAFSVSGGPTFDDTENNSIFSLFYIKVSLTDQGMANVEKVLSAIFSYIKLLQSGKPCHTTYNEIKTMADTNFRFAREMASLEQVQDLAQNMQLYPPTDYIIGSRLIFNCDTKEAEEMIGLLNPEKVNILFMSKTAAERVTLDKTEKWFGAKYNVTDIPANWKEKWKSEKSYSDFFVPPPNPFIPTDFRILTKKSTSTRPVYPEKLLMDKRRELWFKQDDTFLLPFAYVNMYLISPGKGQSSCETEVMYKLMIEMFSIMHDEKLFPAFMAGLGYSLAVADHGLVLSVYGYNEKLEYLVGTVIDLVARVGKDAKLGVFQAVKEGLQKAFYNRMLNPSALAAELRLSLLCDPSSISISRLETIKSINFDQFQKFCHSFLSSLYAKFLIQGNVSREQAIKISDRILTGLECGPLQTESRPRVKVRQVPKGEHVLRVKAINRQDNNCHATDYYQCGLTRDVNESCMVELIMTNISQPLYDTLRTKEQLGYWVTNNMKFTYGVIGFTLTVKFQSDKYSVQHVHDRMANFLRKAATDLQYMSQKDFNRLKASIKLLKQQADDQLVEELNRNWYEIETDQYVFDRLHREIAYLETVTKEDVSKYFTKVITCDPNAGTDSDERCLRKLSIQVDASQNSLDVPTNAHLHDKRAHYVLQLITSDAKKSTEPNLIKNINDFQSRMYVYPSVNPNI